jgi:hypothetical protein
LRLSDGKEVGAFECTFNKKPLFTYKASQEITAYTIRSADWKKHIENPEYNAIFKILKHNIEHNYNSNIKDKIIFL